LHRNAIAKYLELINLMTYPNPAGYYGLKMNIIFQDDISNFDSDRLKQTLGDLAAFLNRDDEAFGYQDSYTCTGFHQWVNTLPESQVIDLIRWIAELLAAKNNEA